MFIPFVDNVNNLLLMLLPRFNADLPFRLRALASHIHEEPSINSGFTQAINPNVGEPVSPAHQRWGKQLL